ncbi:hypothetical protein AX16_009156 [Volvariella volvacea WC 439]|nr:hypothetical protein AX16_009156 [Volvariella volvacea WC 439]
MSIPATPNHRKRRVSIPLELPEDPTIYQPRASTILQDTVWASPWVGQHTPLPPAPAPLYNPAFAYTPWASPFSTPYAGSVGLPSFNQSYTPYITPVHTPYASTTPLWAPSPLQSPGPLPAAGLQSDDQWEPGVYPLVPRGTPVPIHLEKHLVYNGIDANSPLLQWDVLHAAESARIYNGRQKLVPCDLAAPATDPGVSKIWIESDHPMLKYWMQRWGPIMVEKPEGAVVSVCDVLDGIWQYLQQPLTRKDYEINNLTPANVTRLSLAAHQRAQQSAGLPDVNLQAGFLRVDVLGTDRRFQGLRVVVEDNNVWKLYMGLLPGPLPG